MYVVHRDFSYQLYKKHLILSLSRTLFALWFNHNLLQWWVWKWNIIIWILVLEIHCIHIGFLLKVSDTMCIHVLRILYISMSPPLSLFEHRVTFISIVHLIYPSPFKLNLIINMKNTNLSWNQNTWKKYKTIMNTYQFQTIQKEWRLFSSLPLLIGSLFDKNVNCGLQHMSWMIRV